MALVGRSLRNLEAAARECGYLKGIPPFVSEDDADDIPDDNLLILVTGSQGEPRSALARIAADTHPRIELGEGDTVVFSSRVIPGNERAIGTVQDNLVRRGVQADDRRDDHMVHVSGHPARDELRRLYQLVRPRYSVPVHGEWRHLSAHAALAQEAGVDADPAGGRRHPEPVAGHARRWSTARRSGGWCWTATRLRAAAGRGDGRAAADAVQRRRDRQLRGGRGRAAARRAARSARPGCSSRMTRRRRGSSPSCRRAMADLPAPLRRDDARLLDAAKAALRRALGRRLQKRPLVDVHLLRV